MLVILYLVALAAAVGLGVYWGNKSFVMPEQAIGVRIMLVVSGLLALVPVIFFEMTWLPAILSILGWCGWSASFVMARQVAHRIELWERARLAAASRYNDKHRR